MTDKVLLLYLVVIASGSVYLSGRRRAVGYGDYSVSIYALFNVVIERGKSHEHSTHI